MCLGLNNPCIESTRVLDIVVSFKKVLINKLFSSGADCRGFQSRLNLRITEYKKLKSVKFSREYFQNPENIQTGEKMTQMSKIQRFDQSIKMVIN